MYSSYHLYGGKIYFREKDSKTYISSLSIYVGITNGVQGMFCKENGTCTFLAYLDSIKTLTAYEINPYSKNAIQLGQIDSWVYGARMLNDYRTIVLANQNYSEVTFYSI